MPSSSTHNTEQEQDLFDSFTMALARLHLSDLPDLVRKLIMVYECVLDADWKYLVDSAHYSKVWNAEADAIYKYNRPSRVWGAGNIVRTSAEVLWKRYGREEESVLCFELAAHLQQAAGFFYEQEEQARTKEQAYQDHIWRLEQR